MGCATGNRALSVSEIALVHEGIAKKAHLALESL